MAAAAGASERERVRRGNGRCAGAEWDEERLGESACGRCCRALSCCTASVYTSTSLLDDRTVKKEAAEAVVRLYSLRGFAAAGRCCLYSSSLRLRGNRPDQLRPTRGGPKVTLTA